MPKPISAADAPTPVRVVIVTLDNHLASAVERARAHACAASCPGLRPRLHAAAEWGDDPAALDAAAPTSPQADIVVATMLFMEDHIQAVLPALAARREHCDAMVGCHVGRRGRAG